MGEPCAVVRKYGDTLHTSQYFLMAVAHTYTAISTQPSPTPTSKAYTCSLFLSLPTHWLSRLRPGVSRLAFAACRMAACRRKGCLSNADAVGRSDGVLNNHTDIQTHRGPTRPAADTRLRVSLDVWLHIQSEAFCDERLCAFGDV